MRHPRPDTAELAVLRAIHAATLERVMSHLVYDGERRGKTWETYRDAHPGRTILRRSEHDRVVATAAAVHEHPAASRLLERGKPEVSLSWDDCKARIDWLDAENGVIADLKTLGTTDPHAVARMVASYQYHGQMAHYIAGCEAHGIAIRRAYLIVAEGSGAQDVAVYDLDDATLSTGRRLRDRLLAQYRECEASGEWPGRLPEIEPFALPPYVEQS